MSLFRASFPEEMFLMIYGLISLKNEDLFQFSVVNKTTFKRSVDNESGTFCLRAGGVNAIQIRSIVKLIISKGFFNAALFKHITQFSPDLKEVLFEKRITYPLDLIEKGCQSMPKDIKFKLIIPYESLVHWESTLKENNIEFYFYDESNTLINFAGNQANLQSLGFYFSNYMKAEIPINLQKGNDMDKTLAASLVAQLGRSFIEALIIINNTWFFVTSLDLFLHNSQLDDCASSSTIDYSESVASHIFRKHFLGREFYELSIRVGDFELLAVGGFFGDVNGGDIHPFLGSSIPNLPTSITGSLTAVASGIYCPRNTILQVTSNRLLRQYMRKDSLLPWSYHSSRFVKEEFIAFNPVDFKLENGPIHTIASFIISCHAQKKISQNGYVDLLKQMMDSKKLMNITKTTKIRDKKAFFSLLVKRSNNITKYNRLVLTCISDIESAVGKKQFVLSGSMNSKAKKNELVQIANTGLLDRIKSENKKKIKKAFNKYNNV